MVVQYNFILLFSHSTVITLVCFTSGQTSPIDPIDVGCTASGPFPIVSIVCDFDGGSSVEECPSGKLATTQCFKEKSMINVSPSFLGGVTIDFDRFEPGDHVLVITFTDSNGDQASESFPFSVPERLGMSLYIRIYNCEFSVAYNYKYCHVHLSARYEYYVFYLAFCTQAMVADWFCD